MLNVFLPSFGSTFSCQDTQVLLFPGAQANRGQRRRRGTYLLSGAIGVVQVDRDLTLTSAECVHCEDSGTHHPVPAGLDALKRAEVRLSHVTQT